MWSSVFGNATLSNLSGTVLESNKDHLLSQARSHLAKSSHSMSASVIYKNERRRKTGHCRTYTTNLIISSRTNAIARGIVTKVESSSKYADSK